MAPTLATVKQQLADMILAQAPLNADTRSFNKSRPPAGKPLSPQQKSQLAALAARQNDNYMLALKCALDLQADGRSEIFTITITDLAAAMYRVITQMESGLTGATVDLEQQALLDQLIEIQSIIESTEIAPDATPTPGPNSMPEKHQEH